MSTRATTPPKTILDKRWTGISGHLSATTFATIADSRGERKGRPVAGLTAGRLGGGCPGNAEGCCQAEIDARRGLEIIFHQCRLTLR